MKEVLSVITGYLLGSLSFSILISKILHGKDIRSHGSGNPGATNMARTFGMKDGILTLAADVMKTVLSVAIGKHLCGDTGVALAGIGCMLGHCFPVFHHFKGGKGVATGAVAAFAADWRVGICAVVLFAAVVILSRKVSMGSVIGALSVVMTSFIAGIPLPGMLLAGCVSLVVIFRHKENIRRMREGREPDFTVGKNF